VQPELQSGTKPAVPRITTTETVVQPSYACAGSARRSTSSRAGVSNFVTRKGGLTCWSLTGVAAAVWACDEWHPPCHSSRYEGPCMGHSPTSLSVDRRSVGRIASVACTGFMILAVDAQVADALGLGPRLARLPITESGAELRWSSSAELGTPTDYFWEGRLS
jgi:hypothetical protein